MNSHKVLDKFLAENGVSAPFLYNMKHHGKPEIKTTEELFSWIKSNGLKPRHAIFVAFYWNDTPEHKEDKYYWYKISFRWRRKLCKK